jgi:excisionase family DNA binding protein
MAARKPTTIPDHALQTGCAIFATHGLKLTPAQLLRRLMGPDPTGPDKGSRGAKPAPRLLSVKQVADQLNCSSRTVLRMADDKLLTRRYLRPGIAKSLRFAEAEVNAFCGVPE